MLRIVAQADIEDTNDVCKFPVNYSCQLNFQGFVYNLIQCKVVVNITHKKTINSINISDCFAHLHVRRTCNSYAIVRSWLGSTATRSSSFGYFSSINAIS